MREGRLHSSPFIVFKFVFSYKLYWEGKCRIYSFVSRCGNRIVFFTDKNIKVGNRAALYEDEERLPNSEDFVWHKNVGWRRQKRAVYYRCINGCKRSRSDKEKLTKYLPLIRTNRISCSHYDLRRVPIVVQRACSIHFH